MEFSRRFSDLPSGYEQEVKAATERQGRGLELMVPLFSLRGALRWGGVWRGRQTAWAEIEITKKSSALALKESLPLKGFTSEQVKFSGGDRLNVGSELMLPLSYYERSVQVEFRLRGQPLRPLDYFSNSHGAVVRLSYVAPLAIVQMKHVGFE